MLKSARLPFNILPRDLRFLYVEYEVYPGVHLVVIYDGEEAIALDACVIILDETVAGAGNTHQVH